MPAKKTVTDILGKKKEDRSLFIYDVIGDSYYGFIDDIVIKDALKELGAGDIEVRINSPGGDVFKGVSIFNMLNRHEGKVTVHVDALAASIASIIALAADPGQLKMATSAMMMVHNASTFTWGNKEDLSKTMEVLGKVDDTLINAYHERTGKPKDTIAQWMVEETWFTSEEAIEVGLADDSETLAVAAKANVPKGWFSHVPEALQSGGPPYQFAAGPGPSKVKQSKGPTAAAKIREALLRSRG